MKKTIEPIYVTFEQAKLLSQKGFNISLSKVFNTFGELWDSHYSTMSNDDVDYGASCVAPEQWMVLYWLLDTHKLDVIAKYRESNTDKVQGINSVYYDLEIYRLQGGDAHKLYKFNEISDNKTEVYSKGIDYILNNNLI
jgi:hypothetical protein